MSLDLYELLPVYVRQRDAEQGYPLRALLAPLTDQLEVVHRDVAGLYDDLFIETCREWVIPYIGSLVGNTPLHGRDDTATDTASERFEDDLEGSDLRPLATVSRRADVAKTIYYRRRKATPRMLEELATDVTGWPARVVEFFQTLGWTQHLDHLRLTGTGTVALPDVEAVDRIGGAFDPAAHTVDVRPIAQAEGWHNLPNLGFFLWRLESECLERVTARQASSAAWRYHFSPLGNPMPLFLPEQALAAAQSRRSETDTPSPIRRALFHSDLASYAEAGPTRGTVTELYGDSDDSALAVYDDGAYVEPAVDDTASVDAFVPRVVCRRLEPWPANPPSGNVVAIDVATGRLALGAAWSGSSDIQVDCCYGFPTEMGGGPYRREPWILSATDYDFEATVREDGSGGAELSVQAALGAWDPVSEPSALITIEDSATYTLAASLDLTGGATLAIQAADGERPLLIVTGGELEVDASEGTSGEPASLTLSGVVLEGAIDVTGDLGRLRLMHATLVPGRSLDEEGQPVSSLPSLRVRGFSGPDRINTELVVELAFTVSGALRVPEHADELVVLDSTVQALAGAAIAGDLAGSEPAARTLLERTTIVGESRFGSLRASECIFVGNVGVERRQDGCVRFSYVPPGSQTPRRYRCQPDLAIEKALKAAEEAAEEAGAELLEPAKAEIRARVIAAVRPIFQTLRYGRPPYLQLRRETAEEIREGAEDGSEMGVYSRVAQPQRESNLEVRLEEYLPFGLEPGTITAT